MWLYTSYGIAFLYLTNAILEKHNTAHEESIFADVIRNISRVNNVLQELISNYEHLQKIYKSQENTEDDYSSDTEIDEVFKSLQKAKKDLIKKKNTFNPTNKPLDAGSFPATQMVWFEDDDRDTDDIDDKFKEKDQAETAGRLPESEGLVVIGKAPKYDTFENTSSESIEMITNASISKPPVAKIIFIDTHKKIEAINENKNVSPFKMLNTTKKPKTRYNKVSESNKAYMKAVKNKAKNTKKQSNDTKSIKKIIYTETFSSKNIWNEIIRNKPIQLEQQKEIAYDAPQKRAVNKPKASLRSDEGKTALVIVTKNNPKGVKLKEKDAFESPEDETITKEMFKTNVLRDAYGDACMKVVVKKCHKACKQAGKSYCTLYKCKNAFRSKFKELSKTGCVREFMGPQNNNTEVQYRGHDDEFIEATRGRFLDVACLPHVESRQLNKPIHSRNNTTPFKSRPITKYDKTINILRDKYERACKKISAQKCTSACNYAYTNTCDSFKCESKKRKNFKKYCKQQCEIIYNVYSDSDSGDTDSTSLTSDVNTS